MSTNSKSQDLLTEHDSGFYEIEGKLYYMKNNGDMFEVNLDKIKKQKPLIITITTINILLKIT